MRWRRGRERERVRAWVRETEREGRETARDGEREGVSGNEGGREGGRLTLDQRLFFLDSVLRPADGQNRRRRKLASIPAELRHLEVKEKIIKKNRRVSDYKRAVVAVTVLLFLLSSRRPG